MTFSSLRLPLPSAALAAMLSLLCCDAGAHERRFSFTYEVTTAPKGAMEIENWATWKRGRSGQERDRFDFRHELEFGVTDRLQLGVYLADWTYNHRDPEHTARYQHSGLELIYSLSNPTTDFIGSGLYGEVLVGEEAIELEAKLLLQKNLGPVIVAYNATLEAEWEGENYDEERNGEFEQTLGISYEVNPHFSFGAELLHEIELPGWSEAGDSVVYAGPNVSARYGRVSATLTGLFQVTDIESEPDVQTRLIFSFGF